LVKLLIGLLVPEEGEIKIFNRKTNLITNTFLRGIGVSFEDPDFPPWAIVFDYLVFAGRARGLKREDAEAQAVELLKFFELDKKATVKASSLSAGQKKRYSVVLALIGLPKLLILDEPTANLDVQFRIKLLEFLKTLSDTYEVKILILSHVLAELERFSDEIVIIHKGELKYQATVSEIYQKEFPIYYALKGPLSEIFSLMEREKEFFNKNPHVKLDNKIKNRLLNRPISQELVSVPIIIKTPEALKLLNQAIKEQGLSVAIVQEKSLLEQVFLKVIKDR